MTDIDKLIGSKIRLAIEKSGKSIRQIAREANTSPMQIHRVIKGDHSPTLRTLSKIADTLGLCLEIGLATKPLSEEEILKMWKADEISWIAA